MRYIKRDDREIDPQDTLLDSLAQRKDFFGQKRFEVPLPRRAVYGVLLLFLLVVLVLTARSFWLSYVQHDRLSEQARRNYERVYYKQADRGVMYDREGKQLVFNDRRFSLAVYKSDLPFDDEEREAVVRRIAEVSELSSDEVEKRLVESRRDRVFFVKNLSHERLITLQAQVEKVPALYLEETIQRRYPLGSKAAHLLGYLGRAEDSIEYVGKAGLEAFYEERLKGVRERTVVEKDIFGREVSRRRVSEMKPGESLNLWLDSGLQEKVYESLWRTVERSGAEGGAAAVLDVETGGVLSLVSLPSFDNNMFSLELSDEEWSEVFNDPAEPFWNRAVSAVYPSGSVIKPLVAVGALEEGTIEPERIITCPGFIEVENPWRKNEPWIFHDWAVHGPVDMREAIARSCNVYFYTIGGGYNKVEGLGAARLHKYLSLFGWGERTGIDLPGERPGLIPTPAWKRSRFEDETARIWLPGDTYNLSIGQGYLSVSPIQVAASYLPVVNGGRFLEPQVVQGSEPVVVREGFVEEENLRVVREGMREAVEYGSSTLLQSLPVEAGAKTGTAQIGRADRYHNWVVVFAPYDDPEVVMVVMVESVPREQVAALPVAQEVLSWYFNN